jgi:hypothetical protein
MDIYTPLEYIGIFTDKTKQRYARIHAKSDTDVEKALHILKDRDRRSQINFCFLSIADATVDIVALAILPKKCYRLGQEHPFLNTFINQSISILGNLHSF